MRTSRSASCCAIAVPSMALSIGPMALMPSSPISAQHCRLSSIGNDSSRWFGTFLYLSSRSLLPRRYDGVIFLESASVSRLAINSTMLEGGNAHRNEEADEAQRLDHKLRDLWCQHRRYSLLSEALNYRLNYWFWFQVQVDPLQRFVFREDPSYGECVPSDAGRGGERSAAHRRGPTRAL